MLDRQDGAVLAKSAKATVMARKVSMVAAPPVSKKANGLARMSCFIIIPPGGT
jgi:hypothetical protein